MILCGDKRMSGTPAVHVILNQKSGHARGKTQEIEQLFRQAGVEAHIIPITPGSDACELARHAVADSRGTVVAAGGDGTVNAVASAVVGTDSILGVLPVGTLNHFAKDLKIPLDLLGAVRVIAAGHHSKVDTGEVNGKTFVNNSSLGIYPNIVSERQRLQQHGLHKWVSLVIATCKTMARIPHLTVTVRVDTKGETRRTSFVFIGNNEYIVEGPELGRRKRLDAGYLAVYIAPRLTRLGLLRLTRAAIVGKLRDFSGWEILRVEELSIASRRKQVKVSYDGEVSTFHGPLHYRVRPASLNVDVPAEG
jgi:diacylglycerol kinase family enzyme